MKCAEQEARPVEGAGGLWIETVTGRRIRKSGPVRYHAALGLYYCAGGSWPEEIVRGVLVETRGAPAATGEARGGHTLCGFSSSPKGRPFGGPERGGTRGAGEVRS